MMYAIYVARAVSGGFSGLSELDWSIECSICCVLMRANDVSVGSIRH